MTTQEIIETEERYQLRNYKKMPLALVRGQGSYVWDADGKQYADFYGGHCVLPLGHCAPEVTEAIRSQSGTLLFYSNVVYSPERARTAALLAGLVDEQLAHVFFCNSGTEANETALKLARKHTGKPGVVAMEGGFHGRTLGSLGVTWGTHYRSPYAAVLPETHFVPFGDLQAVKQLLEQRNDIAALILEPLQSLAGITEAPLSYYRGLRELCTQHGVALIFDEVQTGVGRTGTFTMAEQLGIVPDLVTMAKSLGSGVPVGAVFVHEDVAAGVRYGDQGTTFGGGMLAMAAVEATVRTILDQNLMQQAVRIFERIREGVGPHVRQVRGRGCLIGIVLDRPTAPVVAALREKGFLTGGSDAPDTMRLMPPLNTSMETVDAFVAAFVEILNAPQP